MSRFGACSARISGDRQTHTHTHTHTQTDRQTHRLVWRSLTPPSIIGKGSGEPRIIDLCHKQNSGSSNQISERNSYIIFLRRYNIRALCAKAGERDGGLV